MVGSWRLRFLFLCLLALGLRWGARAQLVVGVTDRGVYTDSATFTVPTEAGFTYEVTLDDVAVAAGAAQVVSVMDYHELAVRRTLISDGTSTNQTVRFIVVSSRRGSPELGLIEWTPYPPVPSGRGEFAGGELVLVAPRRFPAGLEIPVVAWVDDGPGNARRVNGTVTAPGLSLPLRRGVGHAFLAAASAGATLNQEARVQTLTATKAVQIDPVTDWQTVSGILPADANWAADARIHVTGNLTILASNTLTIGAGAIVLLDPAVNITNSGHTVINGTREAPVVFTAQNRVAPERPAGAWGGFLLRGSSARLTANGAILTGAGAATNFSFSPGSSHRGEQALILAHSGAGVFLTNCFLISNAGQIANGYNSGVTYDHCLLQRAITGGEYEGGTVIVNNSAVIEFPSVDGHYDAAIADADYDGLYFTTGTHTIRDSLIGFAKDDAIDSGSGGAGTVTVTNCWIESALHEGLAWSGRGRQTWCYDSVVLNCGQGLECGWSTGTNSPLCFAERLLSLANSVGARFGDNYQGTTGLGRKAGFLTVTNSVLLHNHRDVFGRPWDDTWNYRTGNMSIHGNILTAPNPFHPDNLVWNPGTDTPRLLPFLRTPPGAVVGLGFANWNAPGRSALTNGIPVRLSTFTTNEVSVDYSVETSDRTLATGTLTFRPGETVRQIVAPSAGLLADELVRVVLRSPVGAEITTGTQLLVLPDGAIPGNAGLIPFKSVWKYLDDGSDQTVAWRAPAFDDSAWPSGHAQLGFGDEDEATPVRRIGNSGGTNVTFYFRHAFALPDPAAISALTLRLLRDDGGVVYLNGAEVFRTANLPASPAQIGFATRALSGGENTLDSVTLSAGGLLAGENHVAVEIHQDSVESSDVSFDLELVGVPAPTAPELRIARFGNDSLLYWLDPALQLETAGDLGDPSGWSPLDGSASPFVLTVTGEARFYRLGNR